METVYEIELTLEELEILRLATTQNMGLSFALSYYAKEKGLDVNATLTKSKMLYDRISSIIEKNTI